MAQPSIKDAIVQIAEEKNLTVASVVETIESALAAAYRKDFGAKNENIHVTFDLENGNARVFDVKTVVEPPKEGSEIAEPAEGDIQEGALKPWELNEKTEILLEDAQKISPEFEVGDEVRKELTPPASYGRVAAQTAKQVIIQKLREAERQTVFDEYKKREGDMLMGTVQRVEGRLVLVDLPRTTAIIPPSEQVERERYRAGDRIKALLLRVEMGGRGPEIVLSRASPEMVRKLFAMEVPEIGNGTVELVAVARESSERTKIAVKSNAPNVDPIGACVGQRGTRVQTVISELGGEKIDVIAWSEDPATFIANALAPAKVISIKLNEDLKEAIAEVAPDQLSLAIGKNGQNVRLASKLVGWNISIVGGESAETAVPEEDAQRQTDDVEETPDDPKDENPQGQTNKNRGPKS